MFAPNTTQIPNYFLDDVMPSLTDTSLRVLFVITRQTLGWIEDLATGRRKDRDWISYSQLVKKTGRSTKPIARALRDLEELGLIETLDESGTILRSKKNRLGKKLFYRVITKIKQVDLNAKPRLEITSVQRKEVGDNLFTKENLLSKDTKVTNTKVFTKVNIASPVGERFIAGSMKKKRTPANKCPNTVDGHRGCLQYIKSVAVDKGHSFINMPKQFKFLHLILKSDFTFDDIDDEIVKLEKDRFYKANGWDFATIAQRLERSNAS